MDNRELDIDIYNWYKRTGSANLVAEIFGKDKRYVLKVVRERQEFYKKRAEEIHALKKTYNFYDDKSLVEEENLVKKNEKQIERLTQQIIHEYHKQQSKEEMKVKTTTKTAKPKKASDIKVKKPANIVSPMLGLVQENQKLGDTISNFKKGIKDKKSVDIDTVNQFLKDLGSIKRKQSSYIKEINN